jgi:uncharacterized protein YcfL
MTMQNPLHGSRIVLLAGLALAAVVLAGCKAPLPAGRGDPITQHPKIVANERMNNALFFGRCVETPATETKPMSVQQEVRSKVSYPLYMQYRFEFYDDRHRLLTRGEQWRFATLEPRTLLSLDGYATELEATDWRLIVRPAR